MMAGMIKKKVAMPASMWDRLRRAAGDEGEPLTVLVRRIVRTWLTDNGY